MSNSYYDVTGLLMAKAITPIITAIFGGFRLEANEEGEGTIGFRVMSESESSSWQGIISALQTHAEALGFKVDEEDLPDAPAEAVLEFLARHYQAEQNESLASMVEQTAFDGDASLDALYTLACAFDDGHGLTAMKYEGAWHSDKARLFHFGGNGAFVGKHVFWSGDSSSFMHTGEQLEAAIEQGDTGEAAKILRTQVGNLLAGFESEEVRVQVKAELLKLLELDEEVLPAATNEEPLDLDMLRRAVAEAISDLYKFGDGVTVHEISGWEWSTPGLEWTRSVYVSDTLGQVSTHKWRLVVRFKQDSGLVDEAYALNSDGQMCGSYDKVEYYVWLGDGDCSDKTDQMAQAIEWCRDLELKGLDPYITNSKNEVLELDELLGGPAVN